MTRDEDLAKLAARLTDQLGDQLVNAYRDRIRITPPGRDAARVDRITCASCADVTVPIGHSIASVSRAVEAEDGAA